MAVLSILFGGVLTLLTAWDAFESVVMPRSVVSLLRFTRFFHRVFWWLWGGISCRMPGQWGELVLGMYGPLATLLLIPLWATGLVFGIALIQWGVEHLSAPQPLGLPADLLNTAACFVTLGLQRPHASFSTRVLAVITAGIGLGFLALVIGYMPTLYQSFSRRESGILLLDSRAGSPPCGVELLRRHLLAGQKQALASFLQEMERWCAEMLESHLSYPTLIAYRSQHDRVSWLSAITALLDATAILRIGIPHPTYEGGVGSWDDHQLAWRAYCCFAMARHAVVDISYVKTTGEEKKTYSDRLPPEAWKDLQAALEGTGLQLEAQGQLEALNALRAEYEPYLISLSESLFMELPPWLPLKGARDNWQSGIRDQLEHFYRLSP